MANNSKDINKTSTEQSNADNTVEASEASVSKAGQEVLVKHEDNLELRRMKLKDRIKAKRERFKENTADMSLKQKTGYFIYYYKWRIIFAVLIIFCICFVSKTLYKNSRPIAISYAVINCNEPGNINTDPFEEYFSYYGYEKKYRIVSNKSVRLDVANVDTNNISNSDVSQFPLLCQNNYYDIILTDKAGLEFLSSWTVVQTLDDALKNTLYEQIAADYSDLIVMSPDSEGANHEYALDISSTAFARSLNLGYNKVYLCFPGTSETNYNHSKRFINYILNMNLDI